MNVKVFEKKYLILSFCLVLLCMDMSGQKRNVIGRYVPEKTSASKKVSKKNVSKKKDALLELAQKITVNANTDSEKVYSIYKWIAANIVYDNTLRHSKKLQNEIYVSEESVVSNALKRRMALCGGFSFLFRDLCEKVGVSAEVVHGFTKDAYGNIQDYNTPNHTWNVVKLNGKWQLLDITWAIGYGNKNKPDDFWYLTRPKDFIYSHYPENRKWTLMNESISFSDFKNR